MPELDRKAEVPELVLAINHMSDRLSGDIQNLSDRIDSVVRDEKDQHTRIVKLEERQTALQRIVYGAVGILITLEIGLVIAALQGWLG